MKIYKILKIMHLITLVYASYLFLRYVNLDKLYMVDILLKTKPVVISITIISILQFICKEAKK